MKSTNTITKYLLCSLFILTLALPLTACGNNSRDVALENLIAYEHENFNRSIFRPAMFSINLAVTTTDISMGDFELSPDVRASVLIDVASREILYSRNLFGQVYPASTTKLMTALLALRYSNMDDIVTVSEHAVDFRWYAQVGGLQAGDRITMSDLLAGMILHSGNDNSRAVAEHIAGTEEAFVEMMNQEARLLGMTSTHFTNSHGLHHSNLYTTTYDLYLLFNALLGDQRFVNFIQLPNIEVQVTDVLGNLRTITWWPTNWYTNRQIDQPLGVRVLGGKTGTTDEAGAGVILYSRDEQNNSFISIIMGAETRESLYLNMTSLLTNGITHARH